MDSTASSSHPFRNGQAGAEAKRLKLLRDRRDELATMSHEIRRVYVSRFSRLLASIALGVGGFFIIAGSLDESLAESFAGLLPGENPAALSTMLLGTWLLAAFALYSGRAWAERRFSVAMSKAVLPTDEVHTDVSRLSYETPAEVGRNIAQRLVPLGRMLSVLASGFIVPVTMLAVYLVVNAGGYPKVDDVELLFAEQAGNLGIIAVMAAIFSLRLAISPNWQPGVWTVLSAALLLVTVFATTTSAMPTVVIGCFLLATTAYLNHRRRTKENTTICREGTPIPPVIRFRKRMSQLWAAIRALPKLYRWSTWKAAGLRIKSAGKRVLGFHPTAAQSMSVAILLMSGVALGVFYTSDTGNVQFASTQSHLKSSGGEDPSSPITQSYSTVRLSDEGWQAGTTIDFHFAYGSTVDATEHLQSAYIPSGWHATVAVYLLQSEDGLEHLNVEALDFVADGPTTRQLSESTPNVVFEHTNCSGADVPLFLKATPYGATQGTASLRYEVKLEMISGCF